MKKLEIIINILCDLVVLGLIIFEMILFFRYVHAYNIYDYETVEKCFFDMIMVGIPSITLLIPYCALR